MLYNLSCLFNGLSVSRETNQRHICTFSQTNKYTYKQINKSNHLLEHKNILTHQNYYTDEITLTTQQYALNNIKNSWTNGLKQINKAILQ